MNFFGHVAIATHISCDFGIGFGCMLPDFAHLLGLRRLSTCDPSLAAGVRLHHDTDRVFHELVVFREACLVEAENLRRVGVARGPAAGAAHVGIELLLDDAIALDAPTQAYYRGSLEAAGPAGLAKSLQFENPEQAARWEALRERLLAAPVAPPVLLPTLLAQRIERTLRHRPRLAIRSDEIEVLATWAERARARLSGDFPRIIEQVLQGLSATYDTVARSTADCLRFRRA